MGSHDTKGDAAVKHELGFCGQRVRAFAKINLGLDIAGRRQDGYHEITSVFQCIDVHDLLTFFCHGGHRAGVGPRISVDHPRVPGGESNLVVRALRALGLGRGIHVILRKNIPVGAGLGGGSADAAATLAHLRPFAAPAHGPCPMQLARQLGADIPFFLRGGTVLVRGIGDELEVLPSSAAHDVLIATPPIHADTAEVYGAYARAPGQYRSAMYMDRVLAGLKEKRLQEAMGEVSNHLRAPAEDRYPGLKDFSDMVARTLGRPVHMTGSGSSYFALYTDRERLLSDWKRLRWHLLRARGRLLVASFRAGAGWSRDGEDDL